MFQACHLVFNFTTADACGQNMATSCTWAALPWILKRAKEQLPGIEIQNAYVEANASSDKKPGAHSMLFSRGTAVQVKTILPEKVMNKYLQVTSEDYLRFVHYIRRISHRNSLVGGGLHINPGNVLTALFMALGQDVACVGESITGSTFDVEKHQGEGGGVEVSLTFPSMLVGSVGGGTALTTQREGLEMIGCYGHGKIRKLAEVCAGFAMALDISSTTAVVAGKFASGHDKLGRNRPEEDAKSVQSKNKNAGKEVKSDAKVQMKTPEVSILKSAIEVAPLKFKSPEIKSTKKKIRPDDTEPYEYFHQAVYANLVLGEDMASLDA